MRKTVLVAIAFLSVTACGTAEPAASGPAPTSTSPAVPTAQEPPAPTAPDDAPSSTPAPQPAPPPPPVTVEGTPCDITEGACVRLSTAESWLISGGKVAYGPVPITSGRPGYETPTGYFPVLHKVKDEWSRPYNAPMPYSTYFTDNGIAFHEGSLTDPSHGCIHLSMEAAIAYFENLQSGEQVQVVA
ncbi:L,D-transpeptidase family protein [Actinosynnema sp. NPDC050436]|uniref:L,D-transpeptidase n=1 Tax=Actinosynnema sp. NPDC050436 TaxID=3155659 RepID=UPI0033ED2C85